MPPRRKSQAELASIAVAENKSKGSTSAVVDDEHDAVPVGEEEVSTTAPNPAAAPATTALPAKSIISVTKQQKDAASGADGIDQYELARTQVTKVAKSAVPDNIQLRKEVILGLIKSSTVFISYLASSALDKTHEAGNKTLSATHVINAFKEMGFPEEYTTQLRREYNERTKLEADRVKANKAAKLDAARAEEQSMEVDADESSSALAPEEESRAVGDESMAIDLSKEGAEEELDEVGEEDDDEEDDAVEDNEDEDEEESVEGDIGDGVVEEAAVENSESIEQAKPT